MAAWTHIAHDSLSLPASSVTWSSISGSYDHLLIKISARSDRSIDIDHIVGIFNSDTGSNYSYTRLDARTSTPATARYSSQTALGYWPIGGDDVTTDTFGTVQAWIPHYANLANYKQVSIWSAAENASAVDNEWGIRSTAGLWSDTAAITQIDLSLDGGADFMAYSTFDLYGITGA